MLLKRATYKVCEHCSDRSRATEEEFGCDGCQQPIVAGSPILNMTVFYNDRDRTHGLEFCSWACVFAVLPKVQTDYFVNLPILSYCEQTPGQTAADFFRAAAQFQE